MTLSRVLLILVATCALTMPLAAASAGPVEATLEARGPIRLEGTAQALAQDGTLLVVPPPSGVAFTIEDARGAMRIVRTSRPAIDNPLAGDVRLEPEHHTETVQLDGARVAVHGARADFLALLVPTGDGIVGIQLPPGARDLATDDQARDFVIGVRRPTPYYYSREVPAHSFRIACSVPDSTVDLRGQVQVVLNGATVDVEGPDGARTWELGERDAAEQRAAGLRTTYRHEATFAILALEEPVVRWEPGAQLEFYTRAPTLAIDGTLRVAAAEGRVVVPGAAAHAHGGAVELTGQLRVQVTRLAEEPSVLGDDRSERTRLRVEGSASQVLVGGRPLLPPLPADAGTVAPALGLAAMVVAWLSGAGTKVLGMALSPAFAGVAPRVLLENDRRRQIYAVVLAQPGVHMRELQRLTALRWGSLQYHVAVLVGMGLLRSAQAGRRTLLACDAHGLSAEQIRALHLLRGIRARRVAGAVASTGGLTQRDLVAMASVSPRLASRYLGLMAELGLVEAMQGRPKRYFATPRMGELLPRAGVGAEPGAPARPPASRDPA